MIKRLNIKIFGKVQGVCFRINVERKARELGLAGFVKNEADGSVFIEAEGEDGALKKFSDWCREGPEWAEVEKVEINKGENLKNYQEFCIKY